MFNCLTKNGMNRYLKIGLFLLLPFSSAAQQNIDSLKTELTNTKNDSLRFVLCRFIYSYYEEVNRDSALSYADVELALSKKNGKKIAEAFSLDNRAYQLMALGHYAQSLQCLMQAFEIAEDARNDKEKSWTLFTSSTFNGDNRLLALCYTHHMFALLMWQTQNDEQTIVHLKEARRISIEIGHGVRQMLADMNLGRSYAKKNWLDSAMFYEREAEQLAFATGFKKYLGQIYGIIGGGVYLKKGEKDSAKKFYEKGVEWSLKENNLTSLCFFAYLELAKFYLAEREKDSALYYSLKDLDVFRSLGSVAGSSVNLGVIYENIYRSYQLQNNEDSVFKYLQLTLQTKDSLYKIRIKDLADFQTVGFNEQLRLQNIEKEKAAYQNKVRTYALLAGIVVFLLVALILYRNNRQKHKANKVLERTLSDLKATQAQLVQSEKMASLGELTAGIAHEIQNPLNFVNNFSEVNKELLTELKAETDKGNLDDVKALADDVIANSEKINYHGKRADAIVKGMLQHSRNSSGKKEPTNINALCDEYLRLAYHGLRAKDKSFNATMQTDFDESIKTINVVPQDIGRVVLNLLTNAFYAVSEKKVKTNDESYKPTVSIATKKQGDKVTVTVGDNGAGIPQAVVGKIFQPFFTTKPTGQGTGLGLSMSYDIVNKGHGGEMNVETKENEGTVFTISLPA